MKSRRSYALFLGVIFIFGLWSVKSAQLQSLRDDWLNSADLARKLGEKGLKLSANTLFNTHTADNYCVKPNVTSDEYIANRPQRIRPEEIQTYINAIVNSGDNSTFNQLQCPHTIGSRYDILLVPDNKHDGKKRYFFALDLYQAVAVLPRLMGSIIEAMLYLGPEYCVLSIVEGRSDDGTWEILNALRYFVENLGAEFHLEVDGINPKAKGVDRIEALSRLRNMALAPLMCGSKAGRKQYAKDSIIIFINDVALCPEDILELLFQHVTQSAHMTCAFDWQDSGSCFYDSWVSRSLAGNTFFDIPRDKWDYKDFLFFDDPPSKKRYDAFLPLQVYSCWGGMATVDAAPFLQRKLKFRASEEDECYAGEPTLLAKDLWRMGMGKIMAVPTVNVAYSDEEARGTKKIRGYVADHVNTTVVALGDDLIPWQIEPPGMVKCLPDFSKPSWTKPI
ncbi:hypothetical protein N7494_007864 [Penicillium frequentans]|uniref:Alpha-1,3-mannosyltransferase CMT1 n=1 Tax=Penicillium frequentans TaxID=3151616 RepID=A0AAD6CTD7_9EURO|nr:hypothetical protein N7494_007864 [Penicillium glabrum]